MKPSVYFNSSRTAYLQLSKFPQSHRLRNKKGSDLRAVGSSKIELRQSPLNPDGFSEDFSNFSSNFFIRSYEVGPDRSTSIVTIANLLQVLPAARRGLAD